jgi:hypothetical protein
MSITYSSYAVFFLRARHISSSIGMQLISKSCLLMRGDHQNLQRRAREESLFIARAAVDCVQ